MTNNHLSRVYSSRGYLPFGEVLPFKNPGEYDYNLKCSDGESECSSSRACYETVTQLVASLSDGSCLQGSPDLQVLCKSEDSSSSFSSLSEVFGKIILKPRVKMVFDTLTATGADYSMRGAAYKLIGNPLVKEVPFELNDLFKMSVVARQAFVKPFYDQYSLIEFGIPRGDAVFSSFSTRLVDFLQDVFFTLGVNASVSCRQVKVRGVWHFVYDLEADSYNSLVLRPQFNGYDEVRCISLYEETVQRPSFGLKIDGGRYISQGVVIQG